MADSPFKRAFNTASANPAVEYFMAYVDAVVAETSASEIASRFLEELRKTKCAEDVASYVDKIIAFSFYDIKSYGDAFKPSEDAFKYMHKLASVRDAAKDMLYPVTRIDFGPLTRKVSPPIEAYKPRDPRDTKPTGRTYGTLFE